MYDEHKTLYRLYLEEQGFTSTRAHDLDQAIKKLHMAICQIDVQAGQYKALKAILDGSIRDLVDKFAEIEGLRRTHEIERSG